MRQDHCILTLIFPVDLIHMFHMVYRFQLVRLEEGRDIGFVDGARVQIDHLVHLIPFVLDRDERIQRLHAVGLLFLVSPLEYFPYARRNVGHARVDRDLLQVLVDELHWIAGLIVAEVALNLLVDDFFFLALAARCLALLRGLRDRAIRSVCHHSVLLLRLPVSLDLRHIFTTAIQVQLQAFHQVDLLLDRGDVFDDASRTDGLLVHGLAAFVLDLRIVG